MHRIMQRLSFQTKDPSHIKQEIEAISNRLALKKEERSAISYQRIIDFHQSSVGTRLLNSKKSEKRGAFFLCST